jgi:hypothetical protein
LTVNSKLTINAYFLEPADPPPLKSPGLAPITPARCCLRTSKTG